MFLTAYSPKLFDSIYILGITLLTASLTQLIFKYILIKIAKKTMVELDDYLISQLQRPTFLTVFLTGFKISLSHYFANPETVNILTNLFYTAFTLIWAWGIGQIFTYLYQTIEKKAAEETSKINLYTFLENITHILIIIITIIILLSIWKINTNPLLTSAGILGIVIGFAAKDTIANFFGGISIFFDQPYKIGDYVIVKNDYRGEIIDIGMRSTRIKTRDNILVSVPNSVMVTDFVINETGLDSKLRIHVPVGVSYNSDLEKVEKVLLKILEDEEEIVKEPVPRVFFRKFGPSAIQVEVLGTMNNPARKGIVTHKLIKEMHKKLKKHNINIPNPQRDIHIYKENE